MLLGLSWRLRLLLRGYSRRDLSVGLLLRLELRRVRLLHGMTSIHRRQRLWLRRPGTQPMVQLELMLLMIEMSLLLLRTWQRHLLLILGLLQLLVTCRSPTACRRAAERGRNPGRPANRM